MARHLFGYTSGDFVVNLSGASLAPIPNAVGTVWNAKVAGTQLTDLLAADGTTPVTSIRSESDGRVGFYGPDGVGACWVDFGAGRYRMASADTATVPIDLADLSDDLKARVVNEVSGLTLQTVPVPPSPPGDGIRVFTQQGRLRFIDRFGAAADVLDTNLAGITLPQTETPAKPAAASRMYVTSDGYLVTIGGSGTITVMAAP